MIEIEKKKKIHFVGIGGIGMSGVAFLLMELGCKISGSDLKDNGLIAKLRSKGAKIFIGHRDSNLEGDVDLVVYTSCIREDNPEMIKARKLNIQIAHRQTMLATLIQEKKGVAITGAHGKGTTTTFTGLCLLEAGLDPTIFVGTEVINFGGNAKVGKGEFFVMETDESDGSFVELQPYYAVLTNIDKEHLEHYKDMGNLISANRKFVDNIKKGGCLFCLYGDKNIQKALKDYRNRYKTFGFSSDSDLYAKDVEVQGITTTFKCLSLGKEIDKFKLMLPGSHNVLNALGAISVALEIGISPSIIKTALSNYKGAARRFEVKGDFGGILVIEDYAHHPTEIKATLEVCKHWHRGKVISIFQPHRFSRTQLLADEFGSAFDMADELILTDIYSAHEDPIKGVSTKLIFDKVKQKGKNEVCLIAKDEIVDYIGSRVNKGDIVLILGAGDIGDISVKIAQRLKEREIKAKLKL